MKMERGKDIVAVAASHDGAVIAQVLRSGESFGAWYSEFGQIRCMDSHQRMNKRELAKHIDKYHKECGKYGHRFEVKLKEDA